MKRCHSLLLSLCAGGLLACNSQQAFADEKGWGLMQQSPHAGLVYVYVTPHGIAIVLSKTGATIVTHAPGWQVVMYNKNTKIYYTCTIDELKNDLDDSPKTRRGLAQVKGTAPQRIGTTTIAGLHAIQYMVQTQMSGALRKYDFWVTDQLTVPPQLKQLLSTVYQLNASNLPTGMPLRVKMLDDIGKKQLVVDTLKCEPQVIHDASFVAPANYKRVDNELLVVLDEKSKRAMESITEDSSSSSDELNALLGSSQRSHYRPSGYQGYRPSGGGYRPVAPQPAYRPQPAAQPQPAKPAAPNPMDWFNNIINSFGKKK